MHARERKIDDLESGCGSFARRHIGPNEVETEGMLGTVGYENLAALIDATVPKNIRLDRPLNLPEAKSESEALAELRAISKKNTIAKSFIGAGYSDCITLPVIQRNVLESPGWYTAYTPYQAEIAQGRLEALLNFQTMVADLTGLEIANASLLDEGTAAAEAMHLTEAVSKHEGKLVYLVDASCHPQTIAVVRTRAAARGIEIVVGDPDSFEFQGNVIGALLQYPTTDGAIRDYRTVCAAAHATGGGALVTVATDLLALALLAPPGEWGADIAVGNSQRFGVPLGYGGPHAAFFATRDAHRRHVPGRIIGVSRDAAGRPALRMALQTREQHIRREKATSNICTAQVLLAVMASMYGVYHGPEGLRRIAERVHGFAAVLADGLRRMSYKLGSEPFFDSIHVWPDEHSGKRVLAVAQERRINLRQFEDGSLGITLDEVTTSAEVQTLFEIFGGGRPVPFTVEDLAAKAGYSFPPALARASKYLTHEVFNRYHSEHEMLRYMHRLESRDLSLVHSMIPLGSCTMKLNATVEMIPVTWKGFSRIHPFAPPVQTPGYQELFHQLESWLAEITGFSAISLQPNAGSQGEYAGLLVIRAYHRHRGESQRDVCLMPVSAHGTT